VTTFLERFFNKQDPTYQDLENFLQSEIEESLNLDYKSGELLVGHQGKNIVNGKLDNNKSDKGFSDLARVLIGFANAEGGLLILGVQELPETINGKRIKIRPGSIEPLPLGIISKEMIESKLRALIQFPLDDLRIVPLKSPNNQDFVCLIDVSQSVRAPHQLSTDHVYYQRRNFFTEAMEHYQVNDLFGKRLAPSLEISFTADTTQTDQNHRIQLQGILNNFGWVIAKYPMCLITIIDEHYKFAVTGSPHGWNKVTEKSAQYTPGGGNVIYPGIGLDLNMPPITASSPEAYGMPLILRCVLCAELTQPKQYTFLLTPQPHVQQQPFQLIEKQDYPYKS
jgi:hypothetical protein